jgi:hypothetical protein
MAFDQLQGFGDEQDDQRFKTLAAWLCTMLGSKAYSPDEMKGFSRELPPLPDEDDIDAFFTCVGEEREASETSSAILRDLAEQNMFRM